MITKDTVFELVNNKGPLIPIDIMRELGGNTFFIGAVLSELSAAGKVKISTVKIGGSPLYYTENQLEKLQNFRNYLNEKDARAFEIIKEKKVLRDKDQNPLVQVCLRSIKDFAKPLNVKFGDNEEIFWKWYLLSDAEAVSEIKILVEGTSKKEEEPAKEEEIPVKEEIIQKPVEHKKEVVESKPAKSESQKEVKDFQKPISSLDDDFSKFVHDYLDASNIAIVKQVIDKKGKEISYELLVPSQVGRVKFYAKAYSKSKLSDSDLSKVFVQATLDKLPALVLHQGDLTKKATEVISRFTNFVVKKME